jgi:glycine/D-amino acid oxidase-like deaminating enzyme
VGWDDDPTVRQWPGLPALSDDVTADACVVGLGGSGLAAVEECAERGLSVVGLDAGRVAAGAAGRNGGFLIAGPYGTVGDASAVWGEDPALDLYRRTREELEHLAHVLGPGVVRRTGAIWLAGLPGEPQDEDEQRDRDEEFGACRAEAAVLRGHGFPVEDYDGPLGRGLFLPAEGAVNPAVRAVRLAERLRASARLYENSPMTAIRAGRVATPAGSVTAGMVIIAVDGRLDVLFPRLSPAVRTARLQMLATAPLPPGRLPCPVFGRHGYDYGQQTPDGRVFLGGGRDRFRAEEWTTDTNPTPSVQGYLDALAARFAGGPVAVERRWAASAGFTEDGRPVCAPVGDRAVAVGGYSGTGNLVGPVAARAAVAWLADGAAPPAFLRSTL